MKKFLCVLFAMLAAFSCFSMIAAAEQSDHCVCDYCGAKFVTAAELDAHYAALNPVKSHKVECTYCTESFTARKALAEHEKMCKVNPDRKIACKYKDNGYTDEEMKMQNEGRRILHAPELQVTCTCVRVPVMRSHSIAVTLHTEKPISVEEAKEAVRHAPGCRLIEDYEGRSYPTPLDTSGQDLVWVGRIRKDLTDPNGLMLWCCGDQIRKGAASNAVQILQKLAESSEYAAAGTRF